MKLTERLAYIFFPARCCICDKAVYPGEENCPECRELIIHYPPKKAACKICGMERKKCPCSKRVLYSHSTVPLFYENEIKHTLHKMKFRGRLDLIKPFASMIAQSLSERKELPLPDIITFVPMSRKAKRSRGYNQSQLLAKEIGRLKNIEVKELLVKSVSTKAQHSLGYSRRHGNVLGVFEPKPEISDEIKNRHILIVDDIITTGSTLNELAKTLLIFGADKVSVVAVAQGKSRKKVKKKIITQSADYHGKIKNTQNRE